MKLRKNSGKILWGLFFILAAVYVVVSKLWIMPEISVFSVLLTVFFIWLFLNGIRNVYFWEILFSIAFICIIYDDWLGIHVFDGCAKIVVNFDIFTNVLSILVVAVTVKLKRNGRAVSALFFEDQRKSNASE